MNLPEIGSKIRCNINAPSSLQGKEFIVAEIRKACMDPWEHCAYRNDDNGDFIYIIVSESGEQLQLDWLELVD